MRIVHALTALAGLAVAAPAQAQCDSRALQRDLAEATPVSVPSAFLALVRCDEGAAKKAAPKAITRALPGPDAGEAAAEALRIGAADAVQSWIGSIPAAQRAQTLDGIAARCAAAPAVADFFVAAASREGERFWKDGWYRGLGDCRTEGIQALLSEAVSGDGARSAFASDRALYFSVLEVYARNLGADAVPRLEQLVGELGDEGEKRLVVSAFADAANVGDPAGTNPEAAKVAVEAIERLGPNLPGTVVDQARNTLLALGAEDLANRFVQHRWPERLTDGRYTYAATVQELVTCKNGKQQAFLHHGLVEEPAARWPNDLQGSLEAVLGKWKTNTAKKCKGTAELAYAMSPEPLADDAAAKAWFTEQQEAFGKKTQGFGKTSDVPQDAVRL